MDSSVTVAGMVTAIHYRRFREIGFQRQNKFLLFQNIAYDYPATRDILHLAKSETFATELLRYRDRGLGQPPRWECTSTSQCSDHSFVRLAKRPSVFVEQPKIALGMSALL
jgi:hypothetical protein